MKKEKIKKQLTKRYKENAKFIMTNFPQVWQHFFYPKGKLKVKVLIENNGNINFEYNGVKGIPSSDSKKKLISSIKNNLYTMRVFQVYKGYPLDKNPNNYISNEHINRVISLFKDKNLVYTPLKKTIPLLIVFGLNLGYHLEWILDNYDVKHLVVIEVDENLANISLYTLNWKKIFKYFQKGKNRYIKLVIFSSLINPNISEREINRITQNLINSSLADIDFFSTDFRFLAYYVNPVIEKFLDSFKENIHLAFRAWGFFNDEIISIDHTYQNIKNKVNLLTKSNQKKDIPVFIVASGPSLDKTINFIKENKKKAFIISAGTALRKLLKNNIKPDIHIEIERTFQTYKALEKQLEGFDKSILDDILLVVTNNVHPKVFTLFKNKLIFPKFNDTGYYAFIEPLGYDAFRLSNPTVSNGALSVAINLGFKEIYLFGTDFGFKLIDKHHADDTIYYDKQLKEVQKLNLEKSNLKKVKGNFTEFVYTNDIFNLSRVMVETAIDENKDIKVYNTSDGAYIRGSVPIKCEDISLKSKVENKTFIINDIIENLAFPLETHLEKQLKTFKAKTLEVINNVINFIENQEIKNFDDFYYLATEMAIYLRNQKQNKYVYPLLNGTTKHILIFSYLGYIYLNEEKKEKINYLNNCKNILLSFYKKAKEKIENIGKDA